MMTSSKTFMPRPHKRWLEKSAGLAEAKSGRRPIAFPRCWRISSRSTDSAGDSSGKAMESPIKYARSGDVHIA
jgi:hypothetical protein